MNSLGSKVLTTQTDPPYGHARPCHIHNAGLLYIYKNKTTCAPIESGLYICY